MPIYTVEIDGKQYDIEGERPPSETEARAAIGAYAPEKAPVPARATVGMLAQSTTTSPSEGYWEDLPGAQGKRYRPPAGAGSERTRPDNSVLGLPPELAVLPALGVGRAAVTAVPGVMSRAAAGAKAGWRYALPAMKYEATKSGLEAVGVPPSVSTALAMIVAGGRRSGAQGAATDAAAPVARTGTQSDLVRELATRTPNWRVTDAVPIDAIKRDITRGGSIIEAGESVPGLADRLAQLLKAPTPESLKEADVLAKALRQRQHIRARVP